MQIKVNGEARELEGPMSVLALARALGLPETQVAIERNREIVPRSRYAEVMLEGGDAVEIVRFIGGG